MSGRTRNILSVTVMRARIRSGADGRRSGRLNDMDRANALTWSVTSLLMALVLAIFAFGGTTGEGAGLVVRLATLGFLILAAVIYMISRHRRKIR